MSDTQIDQLVKMINQIALNLGAGGDEEETAVRVADHLNRFWSAAMKRRIIERMSNLEEGLSPAAVKALHVMERGS